MQRRAIAAALASAIAMSSAGEATAACSHEAFSGNPNAMTTIQMKVSSGEPCAVRHMTTRYGKSEQRRFPSTRMTLNSRPQNGTASISGSRVSYVSKKGFKGTDTFTYTSHHAPIGNNAPRLYRYRMAVTVY